MAMGKRTTRWALGRFLGRLRFPQLFVITAGIFLIDILIPDGLPLADEILLGLVNLILLNLKRRTADPGADPSAEGRVAR